MIPVKCFPLQNFFLGLICMANGEKYGVFAALVQHCQIKTTAGNWRFIVFCVLPLSAF